MTEDVYPSCGSLDATSRESPESTVAVATDFQYSSAFAWKVNGSEVVHAILRGIKPTTTYI